MITNALKTLTDEFQSETGPRNFALQNGDSGLVIRADGTIEMFQQGIDADALRKPDHLLSPSERQMLLNGQTLMVLSIVASTPELQHTILSLAVAEGVANIPTANSNG